MAVRIALCRLNVTNLGDQVIAGTARYIVERVLRETGRDDVEIVEVDIGTDESDGGKIRRGFRVSVLRTLRIAARLLKKVFRSADYARWQWHRSPVYRRYAAGERRKLLDVDMIVFAGGGLVKFHRQNFHFFLDDITALAEERGVPVLFNAVGIEGYDARDGECRLLKRALNRSCVKVVTTRDDLGMLSSCYIENPYVIVKAVCDPAFWCAETYGVRRANGARTIGLNVIRPEIFAEYARPVSREALFRLYEEIVTRLLDAGWRVELFSNGVLKDSAFLREFLAAHPVLAADTRLSTAYPSSPKEFVETIAGYARVMAVRLHAAIVGTVLGVPNVSLVWNRKQPLFGKQVGMPGNFIGMEGVDAANVVRLLLDAKPYAMDADYKASVLDSLREGISRWLPPRKEPVR